MNWLLIIIVLLLALCVVNGYRKGFLRMMYSMVSWVIMFALVTWATPYINTFLRNNTSIYQTIATYCEQQIQEKTEKQIEHLAETGLRTEQVETAIKYMGIQKILNRIEKYAGCAYGTKCAEAENRIRATANTYMDYINMRLALGYDMNNTVYQQPRNLVEAHNQIVLESNKEEMDIRIREVEQKYPSIRAIYRELRKIYFYEDDTYLIRPARSAGEIVREGRLLHHCVGGDNYLGKHNRRESYILMLRFKDKAEEPYITVEISSNNPKIRQWYGTNDRKPDAKNMQKWLNDYLKQLKEKREMLAKTA